MIIYKKSFFWFFKFIFGVLLSFFFYRFHAKLNHQDESAVCKRVCVRLLTNILSTQSSHFISPRNGQCSKCVHWEYTTVQSLLWSAFWCQSSHHLELQYAHDFWSFEIILVLLSFSFTNKIFRRRSLHHWSWKNPESFFLLYTRRIVYTPCTVGNIVNNLRYIVVQK